MTDIGDRIEMRPFVYRSRRGASFKWEPYDCMREDIPDRDPYGEVISPGVRFLRSFGGQEEFILQPFTMTMESAEGKGSPKVPLWESFGNLPLSESAFLGFATQHGPLASNGDIGNFRLRTIRKEPKPNGEKGSIVHIGTVLDTLPFWRQEVALFNLLLTLDEAIERKHTSTLVNIVRPGPHGQMHLWLDFSYQGESVHAIASPEISPHIWEAAGGNASFNPMKAARAFCLDLVQNRLSQFPVEVRLILGLDLNEIFDPGNPKYLPDFAYPVLTPSCLLAAMYWSFALKLAGRSQYRRCCVCGQLGYIGGKGYHKQMVRRDNGDWVHFGTEYETLKKSETRRRQRERKIANGEEIRRPGRPRKTARQEQP